MVQYVKYKTGTIVKIKVQVVKASMAVFFNLFPAGEFGDFHICV